MRKLRLLTLSALAIIFIASSCTKEGPEGPAGATGAQGPAGTPGTPGTPGAGITSYSAWFVTGAAGWSSDDAADYLADFLYDKAAPAVTQAVIDQGIVLAYMKGDPNLTGAPATQVFALPNSVGHLAGFIDTYDFALNAPGNIRFIYKTTSPFFDESDLAVVSFRYVVISGSVLTGRGEATYGGYTASQLKAMPYQQLASTFNIPAEGTNIQ